jgi:hypothetical protein
VLSGHLVHAIEGTRHTGHQRAHVARRLHQVAPPAERLSPGLVADSSSSSGQSSIPRTAAPKPPSRSLGYLALGSGASTSQRSSGSHESDSRELSARAASVTSSPTGPESAAAAPPQSAATPTQSGGGTGLGYLGR